MLYFCCKFVKACLFSCETLKYNFFCPFWPKILDYTSGADILCIFTHFVGARSDIWSWGKCAGTKKFQRSFWNFLVLSADTFSIYFLLWPNYLSHLLLIWLHTDCCLSAMATEPASSLLNLSPPLHACPPIKISGCKQVIFSAAICFMGLKISG